MMFSKPEPDWVPLGQAVFRYGVAGGDGTKATGKPANSDKTDAPAPPSLPELEELLREQSGAHDTEIDLAGATFRFMFVDDAGTFQSSPPWEILRDSVDVNFDPRLEAEALFNTEGFTLVSDEEAARRSKHEDAIRSATGIVWRQYLLRAFDRVVAAKAVTLFGRPEPSADFEVLPADIWPLVDVIDWRNGVGCCPDGTTYWSIHVGPSATQPRRAVASRAPKLAAARRAVEALYPHGVPDADYETNVAVCAKVGDWLKEHHESDVSNDTILRAAGRRK